MASMAEIRNIRSRDALNAEVQKLSGQSLSEAAYRLAFPQLCDGSVYNAISGLMNLSMTDFVNEVCEDRCEIECEDDTIHMYWCGQPWVSFMWDTNCFTFSGNF